MSKIETFDLAKHQKLVEKAKAAEFYETPVWAAQRILDVELLTPQVLDPCAGRGVLGAALKVSGHKSVDIVQLDLNSWPGQPEDIIYPINYLDPWIENQGRDFLSKDFSVMMNPPFSLTCEFVERSFELGARKILMFQRFSFLESSGRADFFQKYPPARIWLCGDRAACFRGDMPEEDIIIDEDLPAEKSNIIKGKKGRSSPTAHAWFVWERGHVGSMSVHHLYKKGK